MYFFRCFDDHTRCQILKDLYDPMASATESYCLDEDVTNISGNFLLDTDSHPYFLA